MAAAVADFRPARSPPEDQEGRRRTGLDPAGAQPRHPARARAPQRGAAGTARRRVRRRDRGRRERRPDLRPREARAQGLRPARRQRRRRRGRRHSAFEVEDNEGWLLGADGRSTRAADRVEGRPGERGSGTRSAPGCRDPGRSGVAARLMPGASHSHCHRRAACAAGQRRRQGAALAAPLAVDGSHCRGRERLCPLGVCSPASPSPRATRTRSATPISDGILDALLAQDPKSRVAVETMVTTGQVHVAGEVTTNAQVNYVDIVRRTILDIGYDSSTKGFDGETCGVSISIGAQSQDIAQGVDTGYETRVEGADDEIGKQGAGDQGLMFGYADADTPELMPLPIGAGPPARPQADRGAPRRHAALPASRREDPGHHRVRRRQAGRASTPWSCPRSTPRTSTSTNMLTPGHHRARSIRPVLDQLDIDSSNTAHPGQPDRSLRRRRPDGRRGPHRPQDHRRHLRRLRPPRRRRLLRQGPVEGRPLGRYAMRWVAKNVVAAGLARRAEVQVAYAIGKAEPVGVFLETFGTATVDPVKIEKAIHEVFDLRPGAIVRDLQLLRPIYQPTAAYGHFGRDDLDLPWERTDRADALKSDRRQLSAPTGPVPGDGCRAVVVRSRRDPGCPPAPRSPSIDRRSWSAHRAGRRARRHAPVARPRKPPGRNERLPAAGRSVARSRWTSRCPTSTGPSTTRSPRPARDGRRGRGRGCGSASPGGWSTASSSTAPTTTEHTGPAGLARARSSRPSPCSRPSSPRCAARWPTATPGRSPTSCASPSRRGTRGSRRRPAPCRRRPAPPAPGARHGWAPLPARARRCSTPSPPAGAAHAVWQALPGRGLARAGSRRPPRATATPVAVRCSSSPTGATSTALHAACVARRWARTHVVALAADLGPAERYRRWLARRPRGGARRRRHPRRGVRPGRTTPGCSRSGTTATTPTPSPARPTRTPATSSSPAPTPAARRCSSAGITRTAEAAGARLLRVGPRRRRRAGDGPRARRRASPPSARTTASSCATPPPGRPACRRSPSRPRAPPSPPARRCSCRSRGAATCPALACARCREPARCRHCAGPLGIPAGARADGPAPPHLPLVRSPERDLPLPGVRVATGCGRRVVGAGRTAEELGRAFPQTVVRSSGGGVAGPRHRAAPAPALVVATPGAEPVAEGGYGAALLLDGAALLARPELRAAEETVRRWFAAAAAGAPGDAGRAGGGGRRVERRRPCRPSCAGTRRGTPGPSSTRATELGLPARGADGRARRRARGAVATSSTTAALPEGAEVLGPVELPASTRLPGADERTERAERSLRAGAAPRGPRPRGGPAAPRRRSARPARSASPVRVLLDPHDPM